MNVASNYIRDGWRRQDDLYSLGEEANEWSVSGHDLAARALQKAMAFARATAGAVVVVRDNETHLVACQGCEETPETELPSELRVDPEVSQVFDGETVVLNPPLVRANQLSVIAVPLRACGEVIGALILAKPDFFYVEERRALTTIAAIIGPHLAEDAGKVALCP